MGNCANWESDSGQGSSVLCLLFCDARGVLLDCSSSAVFIPLVLWIAAGVVTNCACAVCVLVGPKPCGSRKTNKRLTTHPFLYMPPEKSHRAEVEFLSRAGKACAI